MSHQHWDALLYDARHSFVARYGEDLIPLLNPQPGQCILDLGCGTGHLTAKIAAAGADVIGLDSAATMIAQARANYPRLTFIQGDAADFRFDRPFDAVFSNAALHWIRTPEKVVACVRRALPPGGRFVAEFGGKGNVETIIGSIADALDHFGYPPLERDLWYFPSSAEYATLLEAHGFRVAFLAHFDHPTALEGQDAIASYLAMYFPQVMEAVPERTRAAFVAQVEARLRPALYHDGGWTADYVRLRAVAAKDCALN